MQRCILQLMALFTFLTQILLGSWAQAQQLDDEWESQGQVEKTLQENETIYTFAQGFLNYSGDTFENGRVEFDLYTDNERAFSGNSTLRY